MDEIRIRSQVAAFLSGAISLRELDEELAAATWGVDAPEGVRDLSNMVSLRIDEYSSAVISEADLRAALRPIVTEYAVQMLIPGRAGEVVTTVRTGSSASSAARPFTATRTFADTRFAAAS